MEQIDEMDCTSNLILNVMFEMRPILFSCSLCSYMHSVCYTLLESLVCTFTCNSTYIFVYFNKIGTNSFLP